MTTTTATARTTPTTTTTAPTNTRTIITSASTATRLVIVLGTQIRTESRGRPNTQLDHTLDFTICFNGEQSRSNGPCIATLRPPPPPPPCSAIATLPTPPSRVHVIFVGLCACVRWGALCRRIQVTLCHRNFGRTASRGVFGGLRARFASRFRGRADLVHFIFDRLLRRTFSFRRFKHTYSSADAHAPAHDFQSG